MKLTPILCGGICLAIALLCFLTGLLRHFRRTDCDFLAPLLAYDHYDNSFAFFDRSVNLVHPKTGKNVTLHTLKDVLMYNLDGTEHTHKLHSSKLAFEAGTCECMASQMQEKGSIVGMFGREMLVAQCTEELCSHRRGEAFFHCISKHQTLIEDKIGADCNLRNETYAPDYDNLQNEEKFDTACISESIVAETMAQFRAPLTDE